MTNSKPHFLAWLKQRPMQIAQKGFETQLDVLIKVEKYGEGSVYWYADKDPFFPPLDPRDNIELYLARFRSYRLGKEAYDKLVESFKQAIDEYDPPRIMKAGVA